MDKIVPLVLGLLAMLVEDIFLNEVFKTFALILQGDFIGSWLVFIIEIIFTIATPFVIIGFISSLFHGDN